MIYSATCSNVHLQFQHSLQSADEAKYSLTTYTKYQLRITAQYHHYSLLMYGRILRS